MKHLFLLSLFFLFTNSYGQNALDFDGGDDYVQTTYEGVLGSADRTFEAWIFVSADAPASNLAILDYGENLAGSRNTFLIDGSRGLRYLSGGVDANISTGTGLIPDEEWTHVAFVLNSGTGYLYVNGVEEGTGSLSSVDTPSGEADMTLGQRVSGGSIPFYGKIDEVRIWDIARSADDIIETMDTELCRPDGLQAYLKLNEGIAGGINTGVTTAVEQIAGNDGELNNFALTGATSNWVTGVDLDILPTYSITNTFTECDGFSVTVGDNTYTSTGVYTDVFTGVLTCDSTIITDLTILPHAYNELIINECLGYAITINGNTYDETGIYADTVTDGAANGCDSIITLDLTIHTDGINELLISECTPYSIILNDVTYDATGVYIDTIIGAALGGCDSIIHLDLTILEPAVNDLILSGCEGYMVTVNDNEYDETGEYTETIVGGAANGCDSIINLDLTVAEPIDITTSLMDLTITANSMTGTYQWIDCSTMSVIASETEQTITVTENGDYAVIITIGDCADTSDCVTIDNVGLNKTNPNSAFLVYPNPAKDMITVKTTYPGSAYVVVYDLLGKSISNQTYFEGIVELDIENLPPGSYIIEVTYDNKNERHYFVKQ